ncbi:Ubiquitin carboxyl-terminal hydrolase 27 [Acorus calamus]|uniref:Ubiquitin carboxyl-terminal hydrolase n=1 Tax=Acorus calamus TaxID=4465 RepID=A0AAV9FB54_ACOCL|nr:Ubiquitin carboxyl-terminal hydrolase 27 [Acorus calamus]
MDQTSPTHGKTGVKPDLGPGPWVFLTNGLGRLDPLDKTQGFWQRNSPSSQLKNQTMMNCSPSQLHVLVAGALGAGIGLAGLAFAGRGGGGRFGVSWVPGGGDDHRVSLSVAGLQNLGNNCFINVILQISVDVEFFNCLPLSPSLDGSASIVGGCTLEDCLKQFTAVEHVENYQCSSCWHAFTIKYLSLSKEENKGHISFSLVLDFFPFTAAAMGMRIDMHQTPLISHPNHFVVRLGMPMLSRMYGLVDETSSLGACSGDVFTDSTNRTSGDAYMREASEPCVKGTILGTRNCSSSEYKAYQCENMGDNCSNLIPSKNYMYRLSSVVEHYGRSGSGHYTVYRRVRSDSDDNVPVGKSEAIYPHWVHVSDSEVSSVSEETVLAAEASLLFYEKVEVSS